MIFRAIAVWASLLILAVLNGGVRDTWLSPWLGDTFGRALSTVLLCGLILLVTWWTIGWIRLVTAREALTVGALWLALTLAFEFVVGHYGFGKAWSELLADYDLRHGRIWVAVLVVTLLAPLWTVRLRQARADAPPRSAAHRRGRGCHRPDLAREPRPPVGRARGAE